MTQKKVIFAIPLGRRCATTVIIRKKNRARARTRVKKEEEKVLFFLSSLNRDFFF
jgi:hypothetical protein